MVQKTHTGNINATEKNDGYLIAKREAKTTNRELQHDEYKGIPDGQVNRGDGEGYIVSQSVIKAPTTNREFTSDHEYTGTAVGDKKPVSYDDIYNATLNELKQDLLKSRDPTSSNVSLNISKDDINILSREEDPNISESRSLVKTKVYDDRLVERTQDLPERKNLYEEQNRNNPDILQAFKNNPFTKPLDST